METRTHGMRLNPYPTPGAKSNSEHIRDPNVRAEPAEALEDAERGFEALNQAAISSYNTQSVDGHDNGNGSSSSNKNNNKRLNIFERKTFVY